MFITPNTTLNPLEKAERCFKCKADNMQLFNPKFIHQDIVVNNCKTPKPKPTNMTFTHNNIDYGI